MTRPTRKFLAKPYSLTMAALVAGTLMAGCSSSDADEAVEPEAAAQATGETVGGDGSQIQLDPLTASDIEEAGLSGELGCSFATEKGTEPLLLAFGDVGSSDPAPGVVKVAGYVENIAAPGGFDGMTENPTFSGKGKTILIAATGAATGGGESPAQPATLTYQRADGAALELDGFWQCGP